MRTPDDLQRFIDENGIEAQLLRDIGDTPTVPAAAAALKVEPDRILKTLLFLAQKPGERDAPPSAFVVISHGERRVEPDPFARRPVYCRSYWYISGMEWPRAGHSSGRAEIRLNCNAKMTGTPMRTPDDLQRFIDENGIEAQLLRDIGDTPTVPAAAAALKVEPDRILKTLLFLAQKPGERDAPPSAFVVISHGERRVEKRPLADLHGVGIKRIKLAPPDVVLQLLGYPAAYAAPSAPIHRYRPAPPAFT